MTTYDDQLISSLIKKLDRESQKIRIVAINQLGEIGDELCLKELRKRLKFMTKEHQA